MKLGVTDAGSVTSNTCNGASPPAGCPTADVAIATAAGSHSVAADSITNQVYVPIRSNLVAERVARPPTVCSSFSGDPMDDVTGCIAVYRDVGEVPPGAP